MFKPVMRKECILKGLRILSLLLKHIASKLSNIFETLSIFQKSQSSPTSTGNASFLGRPAASIMGATN